MGTNVVVCPEIERKCHRTLVPLTKEHSDLGLVTRAFFRVHGCSVGSYLLASAGLKVANDLLQGDLEASDDAGVVSLRE
jgi:hypothetical protein